MSLCNSRLFWRYYFMSSHRRPKTTKQRRTLRDQRRKTESKTLVQQEKGLWIGGSVMEYLMSAFS